MKGSSSTARNLAFLACIFISMQTMAQNEKEVKRISFDAAYDTALKNNLQLRSGDLQIERSRLLSNTWLDLPKTGIFAENEDMNPQDPKGILKIGVSQSMEWPGVYKARRNLLQQQVRSVEISRQIRALEIKRDVQSVYYTLWYLQSKQQLWWQLDSIYTSLASAAVLRVRTGESAGLDSISAQVKAKELSVQANALNKQIEAQQKLLGRYLNSQNNYWPVESSLQKIMLSMDDTAANNHPQLLLQQQNINIADAEISVQRQSRKPNFDSRFFSQRLYGMENPFSGFSVTVGVPLFSGKTYRSRIQAAQIEKSYQQAVLDYERLNLSAGYTQLYLQLQKEQSLLEFYEGTGLSQSEAIVKAATLAYKGGEIGFVELTQFLSQAIDIRKNHLDALEQYNQLAIQLNYYLNR